MLCILCVNASEHFIHIFQEEGRALNLSEIIVKHFWLQPNVNDVNANIICTSCWGVLDSFHRFYLQVEEAHVRLQKTEEELKLKDESVTHIDEPCSVAFDDLVPDLLNADIKLEVQEDAEVTLPNDSNSCEKKDEPQTPKRKHSSDIKTSPNNETTPARSTRSRTSVEKACTDSDSSSDDEKDNGNDEIDRRNSSPDWQNANSDDDSDYEDTMPQTKAGRKSKKQNAKETRKRGRPKKGEIRDPPRKKKRSPEEQSIKMERIREYDETIAKNMKLACAICLTEFPNFAILKRHYRVAHNECGYAICCGKKFRKRGVLVDHIYTHQNPEYFKCEKCGRVLANRKGLDCHMLTHDTEKQRIFQCDQCTLSFYTRPLLTRHLQTHISERNVKCPDCDKFFSTQDILRTHINNVHNAAYTRICDQCGKSFRRPDAFRRHQLEHDGITQPLVPCEKCGVKLTSKYGLKRHMESMHPETQVMHVCNTCGKIAPSAAALQRHISYMHKMERKYKCPMCDKAFKKTGGLKVSGTCFVL